MKFRLITKGADAIGLLQRLQEEGHDVTIDIRDPLRKDSGKGVIERASGVPSKDTILLFDFVGMGSVADRYKRLGYKVIGASKEADALELDRAAGLQLMHALKIKTPPSFEFSSVDKAIDFVKRTQKPYAIKPNSNDLFTCVGKSVRQTLMMLDFFSQKDEIRHGLVLQRVVKGDEISTECWLKNGQYVEGSANRTIEEKHFLVGNLGKQVGCMASMVWRAKPERWMYEIGEYLPNYTGPIDLNRIFVGNQSFGLEWTPRFGYNAIYALVELLETPLGDALADMSFRLSDEYAFALRISIPPYPLELPDKKLEHSIYQRTKGLLIGRLPEPEHIWLLDFMLENDRLVVAGVDGVIMEVTASGKTPQEAAEKVYSIAERLELKDKQYRTDAHLRAIELLQHERRML